MANINVGDSVMVPGDMYGTVKFIGPVAGKKGTFAGVQLATEYAGRGKNSGEVDGKHYFRTTIPGSGIFLPLEKAVKKPGSAGGGGSVGLGLSGMRASPGPGTPRLASFNQGGRTPGAGTTGMAKPGFSQSIGPGAMRPSGAASPGLKPPLRRESLPRPSSPLRKVNTPTPRSLATPKTRPSGIGLAKSTNGGAVGGPYARPGQRNNFSQSLRQGSSVSAASPSSSLGPESSFDEIPENEAEFTPTPTPNFSRKPGAEADTEKYEAKIQELNEELTEARRQIRDQSTNFVEMERNFNEIQKLMPSLEEGKQTRQGGEDEEDLPRDIVSLRDALREKNDKIKLLTAEFDANRADFRSTIDTLETASSETERVYEKRVDELLEEVRNLQDRSEDVETVAQQLKQLEELVQELEEGLEDARRGEAEARGEVEFLRGEVERSRSELRRERERMKTEEQLNGGGGYSSSSDVQALEAQIMAKDDEIRGLKVIIQNLNAASPKRPNGAISGIGNGHQRNDSTAVEDALQRQIRDLEQLLQQKSAHEEELAQEVKHLRSSVTLSKFPMPVGGAAFGLHTAMRSPHSRGNSHELDRKHLSTGTVGSQRTVVLGPKKNGGTVHERKDSQPVGPESWHDAPSRGASPTQRNHGERERSDDGVTDVSATESTALWCEICEEGGHDILTCSNMFGPGKKGLTSQTSSPRKPGKEAPSGQYEEERPSAPVDLDRPAPLMSRKFMNNAIASAINPTFNPPPEEDLPATPRQADDPGRPETPPPVDEPIASAAPATGSSKLVEGTGAQAGMLAGRTTGVIDPEKWCALCEKDGHDSVDCPVEEAF
ncbi:hypothetical protein A1O7_05429 [Cladophialophora yegresii CBS 114405]|uniref:CAP-Gly domain-containing protein n=1 Tax=Cladophialophora yegresii CBS 114405 TaxID=1182544 RepID=W9W0H9_9EURO|nr:uncharacterized protein A1O7_05429 [Cladophialophora yegresii CBS 114405]EXJ58006.1 hypothetical protein A1O7_05429 [Cladophialophora yegresii CBS 114405]